VMAQALEIVEQLLNARLVADGRVGVGRAARGLGRVLATLTVNVEQLFGRLVEGLERLVAQRPGGRDAVRVDDLAEIVLAQAQ